MDIKRILKNSWRPTVGGLLGCVIGAVLGCVAGGVLFGIYAMTLSPDAYRHQYGEMGGIAMIQWALRGIPVGALLLGALGVGREIWLTRAGNRKP